MARAINAEIGKSARDPQDFYPTPLDFCRVAVGRIAEDWFAGKPPRSILDPGSGGGVWGQACRETWGKDPTVIGLEIDPMRASMSAEMAHYSAIFETDAQYFDPAQWRLSPGRFDLAIGNPPYGDALPAIIERSLAVADVVCFLVKASFWMGGTERHSPGGLFSRWPPTAVYICLPRPYSDHTADYCLLLWRNERVRWQTIPITKKLLWKR